MVFYYIFRDPLPPVTDRPQTESFTKFPLFFGTAIFVFEGINVVLPVENRLRRPGSMLGWAGVLNTSMVVVVSLYIATAFYGYLKFGSEAATGAITLNLPQTELLSLSCQVSIMLAITCSYPLQLYVLVSVLVPSLVQARAPPHHWVRWELAIRLALVSLTCLLAAGVPYLDLFISLLGALVMATLELIFPVIVYTALYWPSITWSGLLKVKHSVTFPLTGKYFDRMELSSYSASWALLLEQSRLSLILLTN